MFSTADTPFLAFLRCVCKSTHVTCIRLLVVVMNERVKAASVGQRICEGGMDSMNALYHSPLSPFSGSEGALGSPEALGHCWWCELERGNAEWGDCASQCPLSTGCYMCPGDGLKEGGDLSSAKVGARFPSNISNSLLLRCWRCGYLAYRYKQCARGAGLVWYSLDLGSVATSKITSNSLSFLACHRGTWAWRWWVWHVATTSFYLGGRQCGNSKNLWKYMIDAELCICLSKGNVSSHF